MKKLFVLLLALGLLLCLSGCAQAPKATLILTCYDYNIVQELTPEESAVVLENAALLERFGFGLEDFGGGTVLLRQIPAELSPEAGEAALAALAQDLLDGKKLDPDALRDRMLHTVACKAAIKAGWHSDRRELEALAREVMERDDLRYCPHGRPIVVTITRTELEKQFKRQ